MIKTFSHTKRLKFCIWIKWKVRREYGISDLCMGGWVVEIESDIRCHIYIYIYWLIFCSTLFLKFYQVSGI